VSTQRWVARGGVAALHLALLAALWLHQPATLRGPDERQRTTVRLILPKPAPPRQPEPPLPRPTLRPQLTEPRPAAPPAVTTEAAPPEAAAAAAAAPPVAALPAEPPRSTLRLTLPSHMAAASAPRNPALDDPRANTPRLTLEDRIAEATGGAGAWVEERTSDNRAQAVGALGDRRSVFRRGDTCVEVFRSRIADTDSFNANVAPRAVSMLGKPYKCK
jgi:hypothetical protein